MLFRVVWEIDVIADTSQEAAKRALEIQRDKQSGATVFQVSPYTSGAGINYRLTDTIDLSGAD